MVASLDQHEAYVVPIEPAEELEPMLPGNVGVVFAVQDAHWKIDAEALLEDQMPAPVLDQLAGDGIGLAIARRHEPLAALEQLRFCRFVHMLPQQSLRHVGCRCDEYHT